MTEVRTMMYQPLLVEYALKSHKDRIAAAERHHRLFRRPVDYTRPAIGLALVSQRSDGSSPSTGECCSAARVA